MANSKLEAAYAAQVKSIRLRLQTFALSRFNAGQFRDVDLAKFIAEVVPVVLAGKKQISQLTDSYLTMTLSQMLGTKVPYKGSFDTSNLRGADNAEVYARPFVTVRTKLSQGLSLDQAVSAGVARLVDILATDAQMAKTHTARNVLESSPIQFYKRVLTGSKSCALCVIASTQHYWVSDLMPIHPGCDCAVEPLPLGTKRYAALGGGNRVIDPETLGLSHKAVQAVTGAADSSGRAPDYRKLIVIHQHGEIGPVLAFKGQHFSGPSVTK